MSYTFREMGLCKESGMSNIKLFESKQTSFSSGSGHGNAGRRGDRRAGGGAGAGEAGALFVTSPS
jgi:hypothetical protein